MIDPLLKSHLEPLVRRRRQVQLWSALAACWLATGLLGLALRLPMAVLAMLGGAAALAVVLRQRRRPPDWRWAARQIENSHPWLNGLLLTAAQQHPANGRDFNYLQHRLIRQALQHRLTHDWLAAVPGSRLALAQAAHLLALAFCLFVLWGLRPTAAGAAHRGAQHAARAGVTVTPGDTSLERGSSLVVMARFEGPVPPSAELVFGPSPDSARRVPLVRSLADPMFGGSVSEVDADFVYHVEYAGQRTRDFHVKVFEHPKLERANADLTFPDYTGQPPKRIEDTRRLSAVEGTRLDLALQFNKPVVSARLVPKGDATNALPLMVESNRPAASLKHFALAASKTYQLHLVDADGRTNKVPAQFVFDVHKNRPPELKLAAPRGDIRPSALEEVRLEGTVWDDFGVRAYGLAYTRAGGETRVIELGRAVPAKEKRPFEHLLRLEDLGLKPDDLLSYFIWADDTGPDGQPRRATGDLFFAEVRPFEEVFREGQGGESQSAQQQGGAQSGDQGSPSAKLAELQKQIISATWRLWREHGAVPATRPDATNKAGTSMLLPREARHTLSARAPATGLGSALLARQVFAQAAARPRPLQLAAAGASQRPDRPQSPPPASGPKPSQFKADTGVVRDSQEQALEQAEALKERVQDPRLAELWEAATKAMEEALEKLKAAEKSPDLLKDALAAEQAAYQALLKLQEREYSVSRRQRASQGGQSSARQQQMRQQLEQMELQQQENRYETERQAQAPQSPERREQLQVMNRLAELARRQQAVNERLKELQTALQEARTEPEREELRRQLKRLQEEEQKLLADVDELQQRMERPENQSRLAQQRQQLEQARQDLQRAADAAQQGSASQALAAGTRAQRQMQQMREELRRQNASEFAEDLREMRAQARELARQQEQVQQQMESLKDTERKRLSDAESTKALLDQLARQKERLTNLVERATQVSQQTEEAEPLVSRELYDTLRKFSQDDAGAVKRLQEELLNTGTFGRGLYERLKQTTEGDGAKALQATSEMLRQGLLPQASQTEEQARAGINTLRGGVERAAERVLGDDTETLRLAQRQLDELTRQLEREMNEARRGAGTNGQPQPGEPRDSQGSRQSQQDGQGQQARAAEGRQSQGEEARAEQGSSQDQAQEARPGGQRRRDSQQPGQSGPQQARAEGQRPGSQPQPGEQSQNPDPQGQAQGQAQAQGQGQGQGQEGGQTDGSPQTAREDASPQAAPNEARQAGRGARSLSDTARRGDNRQSGPRAGGDRGGTGDLVGGWDWLLDDSRREWSGPITGDDFAPWSDGLREVEEMVELPSLRNDLASARERARQLRQDYRRTRQKPDWAVVRLQVMRPLVEVRDQIADELARREPRDKLVPIDRDPVPTKYSDLVRRYYEELGREK